VRRGGETGSPAPAARADQTRFFPEAASSSRLVTPPFPVSVVHMGMSRERVCVERKFFLFPD